MLKTEIGVVRYHIKVPHEFLDLKMVTIPMADQSSVMLHRVETDLILEWAREADEKDRVVRGTPLYFSFITHQALLMIWPPPDRVYFLNLRAHVATEMDLEVQ